MSLKGFTNSAPRTVLHKTHYGFTTPHALQHTRVSCPY